MDCKKLISLISICLIFFSGLNAQKIYDLNWKREFTLLGAGSGALAGGYIIDQRRGPSTIDQLSRLDVEGIPSFDKQAIHNFSTSANNISDVFKNGFVAIPFSLLLSSQGRENYQEILFMYSEVGAINLGFTILMKSSVGRYRPSAYNGNVDLETKLEADTRRSFFSGHTSHVASMSFFTASVFADLYPDSKYRYLVWAGALTAPAVTGYLRVKAGRHFPSDVIVGYGVGALIGYFVPKFHKSSVFEDVSIRGSFENIGVSIVF